MKNFVYKRRLLSVADLLDKVKPERFNFREWVGNNWQGKANLSCGTQACALGYASTIPALRKAGLRLKKSWNGNSGWPCLKNTEPTDDMASVLEATKEIFDLSREETYFVFIPGPDCDGFMRARHMELFDQYGLPQQATAKQVAANIRFFVNHKYPGRGNVSKK